MRSDTTVASLTYTSDVEFDRSECWNPGDNKEVYVYRGQVLTKVLPTFAGSAAGPFVCYCPLTVIEFAVPLPSFMLMDKSTIIISPPLGLMLGQYPVYPVV